MLLITIGFCLSHWLALAAEPESEQWNNVDIMIRYKHAVITIPSGPQEHLKDTLRLPGLSLSAPAIYKVTANDISNAGCSTNFSTETKRILKKARCSPRPLLINILTEEAQVKPSYILTKQCTGYCDERRICEARKTVNKTIPVQIIPYSNKEQKLLCRTVSIPEDTRCKCVCIKKKRDCTPQQTYNKSFCSCDCINKKEREHCEKKSKIMDLHTWDDQTCSCVCRRQMPCTTGTSWDSKMCKCSRNVENKG
ncbi:uncharacterized protein LOC143205097 isoform X2 [Rhynchophorus ferrugineus]|uniref:uncharacterized protein LOC143205097 isoform X2 n=1 Tax=Rhynchophorus ferrugineus TaxID=354439 RepID=UPI003FCDE399